MLAGTRNVCTKDIWLEEGESAKSITITVQKLTVLFVTYFMT
jgi:hypothetical protein